MSIPEHVFIVTRVDFDSMENDAGNAQHRTFVGFAMSRDEADEWVRRPGGWPTKRAWDGEHYPKFEVSGPIGRVGR